MSQTPLLGTAALPSIPVTASSIGIVPTSPLTGTTVQDIIDELQTEVAGLSGDFLTVIEGGGGTVKSHGAMGATETIDLADGNYHYGTLDANCTLTFTVTAGAADREFWLELLEDGTGGWTPTWPGTVTFPGGTPTHDTTAGTTTIYGFISRDGGSNWIGGILSTGVAGGTPALTFSTTNAAGSAATAVLTDATIALFDATVPTTQALGDAAATGSAGKAARRDHLHGMPSVADITAALSLPPAHAHVNNVTYSGDGSTTIFTLPVAPVDAYSIGVYVAGSRSQDWTLSGAILDTLTFGSAPASATDNIVVDIAAVLL